MKIISIVRPKEIINRYCNYQILIDGKVVAHIHNNKKLELTVSDENKNIQVRIWGGRSIKYDLSNLNGDDMLIVKGNVSLTVSLTLLGAVLPIIAILLNTMDANLSAYYAIFLFILLVVMLSFTFFKNSWIKLERKI